MVERLVKKDAVTSPGKLGSGARSTMDRSDLLSLNRRWSSSSHPGGMKQYAQSQLHRINEAEAPSHRFR